MFKASAGQIHRNNFGITHRWLLHIDNIGSNLEGFNHKIHGNLRKENILFLMTCLAHGGLSMHISGFELIISKWENNT